MRLVIAIAWILAAGALHMSAAGELSGRRAPGFSLPDPRFEFHDLADYRGKVVLLSVMKTGCAGCQVLAKVIEEATGEYGEKVVILNVVNPPDNPQTVSDYATRYRITATILLDCGQMVASYMRPNPARPSFHVPHLFVIDPAGMIRNDFDHLDAAELTPEQLSAEIERLLEEVSGKSSGR